MRACILVIAVLVSFSTCGMSEEKSSPKRKANSLNEAIFEYIAAEQKLGPQHPAFIQLKTEIENRTRAGERLDISDLDSRLTRCFRDYQDKKDRLSLQHPVTQRTLKELSITTKLLSYDSEYFAQNWEKLLAN